MRPIVEVMTVNFSLLASIIVTEQCRNLIAHVHHGGHTHWCGIGRHIGTNMWEQPMCPGLIVLSAGTWCPEICCMPLFKVQTLWFCSSILSLNIKEILRKLPGHYRSQSKKRRKRFSDYGSAVYAVKRQMRLKQILKLSRSFDLPTPTKPLRSKHTGNYCGRSLAFRQYFCWSIGWIMEKCFMTWRPVQLCGAEVLIPMPIIWRKWLFLR
jgi:hypothetical protein